MKGRARSVIQLLILFSFAAFIIWFTLRGLKPEEKTQLKDAFIRADYLWIGISLVIAFIGHFLRAYRWNYLLEPTGHRVTTFTGTCHVMIGYFANYGIPRSGEVARCTLAKRYDNVPFEVGFGTVITERIIDFIIFILIFFITLGVEAERIATLADKHIFSKASALTNKIASNNLYLLIFVAGIVTCVLGFMYIRKKLSGKVREKINGVAKGIGEGIGSVRKLKSPLTFILLSLSIWLCYYLALYLCFFALPETAVLSPSACLTLLLFGTLGVIFTPGGLGAYPAIIGAIAFEAYKIEQSYGVALGWLSWGSQFILIVIIGSVAIIALRRRKKNTDVVPQQDPA